jgi:DNA-binding transcriptional LysR family regulator
VRQAELEAALVTLPIDDRGLDVMPFARDEVVYVTGRPGSGRGPVSIADLVRRPLVFYDAESGDRDPLRPQLQERAQELGLRLRPRIEAETMVVALRLVADGVGDTFVPKAHTRTPYFPFGLGTLSFRPVVHETFAIVTRTDARPSPATRSFSEMVIAHMLSPQVGLDAVPRPAMVPPKRARRP